MPRAMGKNYPVFAAPATEIARRACINVRHVNVAVKNGELKTHRIGTKKLILISDAIRWIESK